MNIDKDSLIENLQGIVLAQTHTMATMFKVQVKVEFTAASGGKLPLPLDLHAHHARLK